jgi:hypothetical protein
MIMEGTKKKRERSKAYPGCNLEQCVQDLIKTKKALGRGVHDRDSIAKAIGYENMCGPAAVKISAMVQFGLLDKIEGGYSINSDSSKISDPISNEEKSIALKDSFRKPRFYVELLEKFEGDGMIPSQLGTHLHRFHGISLNASEIAAKIFRESGVYAGILNEEGKILSDNPSAADRDVNNKQNNGGSEQSAIDSMELDKEPVEDKKQTQIQRQYIFPLSGGTAFLKLPAKITQKDIQILKKHIELFELEIE